jgi:ABC-type antimicrobial peptide transport system permease subunit
LGVILKLSLLNMTRHKDRASFTIIGLALALGILFFVYSIGISYQTNVSSSFSYVTRDGVNLWVTPSHGFNYDSQSQLIFANGTISYNVYTQINEAITNGTFPQSTFAYAELITRTNLDGRDIILWGTTRLSETGSPLQVMMNQQAANALGVTISQQFTIDNQPVVYAEPIVNLQTTDNLVMVPLNLAFQMLNQTSGPQSVSWVLVKAPYFKTTANWISEQFNFVESTSPNAQINPNVAGVIFILPAGFTRYAVVPFSSQLSAISLSKVVNTTYGLLADISLGLGFILVVSTALLNMEERRRELGMWSAIGIAEDTFFIFLIESIFVYAIAAGLGFLVGVIFSAAFAPWTLQPSTLGSTSLAILPYFPTLVIIGSLVPLQILLNKKPLDLLLNR